MRRFYERDRQKAREGRRGIHQGVKLSPCHFPGGISAILAIELTQRRASVSVPISIDLIAWRWLSLYGRSVTDSVESADFRGARGTLQKSDLHNRSVLNDPVLRDIKAASKDRLEIPF
jgi:hypothetical protein